MSQLSEHASRQEIYLMHPSQPRISSTFKNSPSQEFHPILDVGQPRISSKFRYQRGKIFIYVLLDISQPRIPPSKIFHITHPTKKFILLNPCKSNRMFCFTRSIIFNSVLFKFDMIRLESQRTISPS